ncbi:sialoadhesin-like isoform X1 [Labeo rohita]|uniref:Sialoadhesin-like isoform X1 n=1 Tax=Labeo rohita TaxID=84645 RepID=A0A498LCH2_LABRO|nr:sialoadhesin-like isoform X1 [Labeo rohita]
MGPHTTLSALPTYLSNVKDIHSVLEITVYDEDRDRSADFLGKVAIPLLNIRNSEQKAYVLKNKELTGPTKGVIFLEADVIFNAVKASLRTFVPPEQKYIEEEAKVSKQSGCWDVTYTSTRVCALVNSTVDISCTYSHPSAYTVNKTFWDYIRRGDIKDLREEHQFAGRVEYVENKLRIKELEISNFEEYRFRIITDFIDRYSGSPGLILTVQRQKEAAAVSEEEDVILSCSTNCTLNNNHAYIWYKNGRQVTDGFTKVNKLYLDSVSNEELQQYSCAVGDPVNSTVFSHYTVTLLLFLPQFLIIAALWMCSEDGGGEKRVFWCS